MARYRRARADGVKRHLVSLHATVTDAATMRVAAAVFAWLAGVVAFAIVTPVWVTASLAVAALAAAATLASSRRLRTGAIGALVVTVVGGTCYLAAVAGDGSAEARAVHWVPLALGLDAALEGEDLTYGKRWGSTMHADANDWLLFKLRIRNTSAARSPALSSRLYAGPGQMTRFVAVRFRASEYGPFTPGPKVKVLAQSNGLDEFHYRGSWLESPDGSSERLEPAMVALPNQVGEAYSFLQWEVPPIPPHGEVTVGVKGSYGTPESSQIEGGSIVEMENLDADSGGYATTVAGDPGDRLGVAILFHNSGFRSAAVFARLKISPHPARAYARIRVFVNDGFDGERELGFGTVNSESGRPIDVAVEPGTTELIRVKTDCAPEMHLPFADGVAEGGLELGGIGGFHARDACGGREFNRWLFFKARVLPDREAVAVR